MITLVAVVAVAYLVGAIPFSYLAGRIARGIDLREHGSGNLGASNTFRILGPRVAGAVLALDVAKGFAPVWAAARLPGPGVDPHWLALAAMFAAVFGHMFSVYVRFSGGKGIATSAGAFLALDPWAFLGAFTVWAVVFAARRIVSLASIAGAVSLPVFVLLVPRLGLAPARTSTVVLSVAIMAIVVVKHRGNIQRLLAGTEPRLARRRG